MPECLDCGTVVSDIEDGDEEGEVRCFDCDYRKNLKKVIRKTTLYCFITIILLGLGANILILSLSILF